MRIALLDPINMVPYYNLGIATGLADIDCQVDYYTSTFLYDSTLPPAPQIKIHTAYFRGLEAPWLLRYPRLRRVMRGLAYPIGHGAVWNQLRQQHPDVVHWQWARLPHLDRWLVAAIARMGIPQVYTVHDVVPLFQSAPSPALQTLYQTMQAFILHSEANRQDFLSTFQGIDSRKTHVIPLVAWPPNPRPRQTSKTKAREILGLDPQCFVVGFFGSLRPYKGVDLLLEAFRSIQNDCPDAWLLIAGNPDSPADVPTIMEGERIHLTAGYIPYQRAWAYHLACDVMVFPYRHIYQSAALLTAMAYGLPIIASNVGSFPETVQGNGWLVESQNPPALAQAIRQAYQDRAQLAVLGQRSLELVATRYAPHAIAQDHLALYRSLLTPPN